MYFRNKLTYESNFQVNIPSGIIFGLSLKLIIGHGNNGKNQID